MPRDELTQLVAESLRDDDAWDKLTEEHDPHLIRHALATLRADMKIQRDRHAARLNDGTWTQDQYDTWYKSSLGFSSGLNRRFSQIEPIARKLQPETKNYYRRRHAEDTSIIAHLVQTIDKYLEDDSQPATLLEEALDTVRNFGPEHGDMTLFDALEAGMFHNSTPPRRTHTSE